MNEDPKVQSYLRSIGIEANVKDRNVVSSLDFRAALNLVNVDEAKLKEAYKNNPSKNLTRAIHKEDSDFCGGDFTDLDNSLKGKVDLKPYTEAYNKYLDCGITERLRAVDGFGKPRRKRRMSEHDGDWDFDRKWDLKPYQNCKREQSDIKVVKIIAEFTCTGFVSAYDITKFGSFVWAANKIIEDSGLQTEVLYRQNVRGCGEHYDIGMISDIQLKKSGEYIAPQILAACFTSNFYRRLGFGLRVMTMPVRKGEVCSSGMGGSRSTDKSVKYSDGVLHISYGAHTKPFSDFENELLKMVRKESK